MRPVSYTSDHLLEIFNEQRVLSLEAITKALGSPSRATVFRKLQALGGLASYSHQGRFHTLDVIADFDCNGLWRFNDIRFSRHGTLLKTVVQLVQNAPDGYFASELQELLGVRVHNALAQLYGSGGVARKQLGSTYLYLCSERIEEQLEKRQEAMNAAVAERAGIEEKGSQIAENMRLLLSALNEKQRRLYLGLESIKIGRGGDTKVSKMTGVNVKTIARGRKELEARDVDVERIRRAGAGRPPLKKTPK